MLLLGSVVSSQDRGSQGNITYSYFVMLIADNVELRSRPRRNGITWKQQHLPEINSEVLNNYFYIPAF